MDFHRSGGGLLAKLVTIALAAGRVTLEVYLTDFKALLKADASPVTEADERAEAIILAELKSIAPDVPVIAEEEFAAGRIPAMASTIFLVDPLDGTKEFLARNGEFTVNIALIEDGVPVIGVVYAPAIGVLYTGSASGAFKARVVEGELVEVARIDVRTASAALNVVGSRSHGSQEAIAWLGRFPDVSYVSAGSSLKFCLVAEGSADIYPRFGRTMEWDTAAGDAVLRAAGGLVTTCDGHPLTYNKRVQANDAPFTNPHFLAFGDRSLVQAAIAPIRAATR